MSKQGQDQETKDRLKRILSGAFSGPPQPLKAIPKRKKRANASSRASEKNAQP